MFLCKGRQKKGTGAFILRFCEFYHRWQMRTPDAEAVGNNMLRPQLFRGLQQGPVWLELECLIWHTLTLTFVAIGKRPKLWSGKPPGEEESRESTAPTLPTLLNPPPPV